MPILLPPIDFDTGKLRRFTDEELELIDLKTRGVRTDNSHIVDEFSPDGSQSNRRFSCSWEERYAAAILLAGFCKTYTESGVTKISRLLPDQHPAFTNFNWICTKVTIEPWCHTGTVTPANTVSRQVADFTRADLRAVYQMVPYNVYDDDETETELDRYVTEPGYPGAEISLSAEYIQLAGGTMKFTSGDGISKPAGVAIPYGIGYTETLTRKSAIWRRVPKSIWGPDRPLTQMVKGDGVTRGYIGSINETEIWGHPPLSLKLEGVSERLLPDPSGFGYSWDIGYLFTEKNTPCGHTGLYFGSSPSSDFAGINAGYYQAVNGRSGVSATTRTVAELAADDSLTLFPVREFRDLFAPGGV